MSERVKTPAKRRYRSWTVHFLAECEHCQWTTQDHLTGPAAASRHARTTGHKVTGERGSAIRYE